MEQQRPHFLLVTFPAQGHINPALQFAKRLLRAGADVTFATAASAHKCLKKATIPDGMTLTTFSDGYDDGFKASDGDVTNYMSTFRQRGVETLSTLFDKSVAEGKPITCLMYTLLLPWAAEVARMFHVPSALLWIQPATVFNIYYYYFNGYNEAINECEKDPSWSLELPNMPLKLKARDLPSFLLPSNPSLYTFALPTFQEQIQQLEIEDKPIILVNTFEALEVHALKAIERFTLIPIGPILPSAFLNGKDPSDKSFGGDLFQQSKEADYMEWLNSQGKNSKVVYVSFGSISVLSKPQMEELAKALIQTHRPFLWVIREKASQETNEEDNKEEDELSCMEELKQQGLIVPWCSQVEVLSHPSVGCFVTHCGWNSTLESLTSGVPMVGFPQWTDQTTNAKLLEDLWKTGVRVNVSKDEEGGVLVKSDEIKRCLEEVMESEEIKENAKKWRELAVEAANEGGSSDKNLKDFMEELFSNVKSKKIHE
ncbi:crocetin glucosyltransferase, chloroplastic-like [Chenopodium quinoa]|uniref:Glycosyltransferase n=1 Tax=Chenopodium quinoa TaxID=63459 RepID=A0A803LZJ4_CHEQI|nr:crocetin glucosyltransferase, chloroplastic-like [Chenopodium quinoa]